MHKATPSGNKQRKQELEHKCKINCGRCPYNRKENSKRHPRPDKYKNHRLNAKPNNQIFAQTLWQTNGYLAEYPLEAQ